MLRSTFTRSLMCAAALSMGAAGCASVDEIQEWDAGVEKSSDPLGDFSKFLDHDAFKVLSHVNGVIALAGVFGFDVGSLFGGESEAVTLSEETIEKIADAVGARVDDLLFQHEESNNTASFESLLFKEYRYARPAFLNGYRQNCVLEGGDYDSPLPDACGVEADELIAARQYAEDLRSDARDLYDQVQDQVGSGLDKQRRQLAFGQHVQRIGATLVFAEQEVVLYQLAQGPRVFSSPNTDAPKEIAGDIYDYLDDLEGAVDAVAEGSFGDVYYDVLSDIDDDEWAVETCFTAPLGEYCIHHDTWGNADNASVNSVRKARDREVARYAMAQLHAPAFGEAYYGMRDSFARIAGKRRAEVPEVDTQVRYGDRIRLRSHHGKYLNASDNRGGVHANSGNAGYHELFTILNAEGRAGDTVVKFGDRISMSTWRKRWLAAHTPVNQNRVRATVEGAPTRRGWNNFILENGTRGRALRCGDQIALKGHHGKYIVAESNGAANANRDALGPWEKFTVECPYVDAAVAYTHAARAELATAQAEFEAAEAQAAAQLTPSDWQCVPGISTPVRLSGGDVECASNNGRDCLWGTCQGAGATQPSGQMAPLACGDDHTAQWGGPGYNNPRHWCAKVCDTFNCGK